MIIYILSACILSSWVYLITNTVIRYMRHWLYNNLLTNCPSSHSENVYVSHIALNVVMWSYWLSSPKAFHLALTSVGIPVHTSPSRAKVVAATVLVVLIIITRFTSVNIRGNWKEKKITKFMTHRSWKLHDIEKGPGREATKYFLHHFYRVPTQLHLEYGKAGGISFLAYSI